MKELTEVGIECEPIRIDDYTGKKKTAFEEGLKVGIRLMMEVYSL